ncbi:integrin alpha-X-like isoform X2 [Clupea harengus]|uniref:Integrin alpha-X-like isoform X2 n=1 Tax=Clupea harengus TaxID=7950 RepID=A0A6P8F5E7_CLUHA|nr:integrin alpha-X-like isoform X2 [Clupea harengus]
MTCTPTSHTKHISRTRNPSHFSSSYLLNSRPREGFMSHLHLHDNAFSCVETVPSPAANLSLGLTMTAGETGSTAVVCGPTIPKECDGLTLYGGMCFSISQSLSVRGPVPATLRDCQSGIDIVFLLDGSASLSPYQFITMKKFVINLIKKFIAKDTQFAIAQYSSGYETPLNFEQFNHHKEGKDWEKEIMNIQQEMTSTYTAKAINTTVFELFTESAGARPHASRVLLVITDGVSDDKENLKPAVENAAKKNIIRFAIGVGHVSDEELKIIASEPVEKHKFKVSDFRALDGLKETLEKNIVSVEGGGGSTKLEMAQEGFSGAPYHSPEEGIVMGFVGAYQWRGGYQKYNISGGHSDFQKANLLETNGDDSYLGYSLTVALRNSQRYVILGAPRYRHKGVVVVFHPSGIQTSLEKEDQQSQIGAYFGAEVCVVDLDGDSNTDLILASAPMHTEGGREGRVFVYQFFEEDSTVVSDAGVSLLGMEGQRGRFGSSLASLADLNGDGIRDVAVGAPLEDNGQGSVYIFNGRTRGVNPKYSQRIAGSSVQSGLRFFGLTVAQSALDQSGDGLPDIAVGSKGAVLLLRSRPVVSVETEVFYSPSKIPTRVSNCSEPLSVNATVCFLMSRVTAGSTGRSTLLCVSSCRVSLQAAQVGQHFCVFPHVECHCRQAAQVGQHFCVFPHVECHSRQAAQVGQHFCVFPHVECHSRQAAQVGQHFCVFPHVECHCRQHRSVNTSVCFLMSSVTADRQHRSVNTSVCFLMSSVTAGSTGRSTLLCVSSCRVSLQAAQVGQHFCVFPHVECHCRQHRSVNTSVCFLMSSVTADRQHRSVNTSVCFLMSSVTAGSTGRSTLLCVSSCRVSLQGRQHRSVNTSVCFLMSSVTADRQHRSVNTSVCFLMSSVTADRQHRSVNTSVCFLMSSVTAGSTGRSTLLCVSSCRVSLQCRQHRSVNTSVCFLMSSVTADRQHRSVNTSVCFLMSSVTADRQHRSVNTSVCFLMSSVTAGSTGRSTLLCVSSCRVSQQAAQVGQHFCVFPHVECHCSAGSTGRSTLLCVSSCRVSLQTGSTGRSTLLCVSSCRVSLQAAQVGQHFCVFPHVECHSRQAAQVGQHFCVFPHVECHCRQAAQVGQHFCVFPHVEGHCRQHRSVNTSVCFLMSSVTAGSTDLRAKLSYTFTLDHVRQTPRATFAPNQHATSDSITATLQKSCLPLSFATHGCPEDALNPIANRVAFTFDGLPITGEGNLRPRLSTDSRLISYHMLNFEIDCGPDKICEDNLRVDFNFSGATHIDVGVAQDLYVTVMVENRGENSYNTRVSLSYPDGLSYRTFTKTQGRVACSSRDGEDGVAPGKTTCSINKPIFTAGDTAVFVVQYGVPDRPTFDQSVSFTANLTSGNDLHAPDSRHFAETEIGVRHSIHVVIRRHENTTGYVTFKADESSVERPVTQLLQVENGNRRLNLSVMIRVPVKLGKMDIWSDMKALSIAGCQRSHDMKPTTDLPVETLKKTQIMNCSVAACRVFKCDVYLKKKDCVFYKISGKVHSGWISQTGVRSGQIILVSESNLEYDSNKYILPSADGLQSSSFTMLGTQVEVYEEPKFTKEITGGVLGGLLLLILVTVGLVKVGFFTSQYTQRLQESANDN